MVAVSVYVLRRGDRRPRGTGSAILSLIDDLGLQVQCAWVHTCGACVPVCSCACVYVAREVGVITAQPCFVVVLSCLVVAREGCVACVCVQSNVLPSTTSAERRFILLNGKLEVHHAPCTPLQMLLSLGGLGGKVVRTRVTE